MKSGMRGIVYSLAIIGLFALACGELQAKSVAEKAQEKRIQVLGYLRLLRPMAMNFPCEPYPRCEKEEKAAGRTLKRVKEYESIKRVYQEGMVYLVEQNFVNSYLRFIDAQRKTELLLESLSQSYIDRTELMLRDAIEKKDPKSDEDMALVDISLEYGKDSKFRRDFAFNRQAPMETRRFNPRLVHYARNKYRIEKNMEKGYYHLGMARKVRLAALTVDANLAPHQKLQPYHRQKRIELYLGAIKLCRLAKFNAEMIFRLKYPYDNYGMAGLPDKDLAKMVEDNKFDKEKIPEIENIRMEWINNPFYLPKNLNPVFDMRLPETYRRDATDLRRMVYDDEIDRNVRFKYLKDSPARIISDRTGKKEEVPAKTKKQP